MLFANVVARLEPFHCTVVAETNPVPVTVNVKAGPPAIAEVGESELTCGGGLLPPFELEQPDASVAAIQTNPRRTLFDLIDYPAVPSDPCHGSERIAGTLPRSAQSIGLSRTQRGPVYLDNRKTRGKALKEKR